MSYLEEDKTYKYLSVLIYSIKQTLLMYELQISTLFFGNSHIGEKTFE